MIRSLVAAAVLTGVLGVSAPALAVPADPPEVAYRSGTVVHLPNGRTVTLPVRADVEVLGRRAGQWLVHVDRGDDSVVAVRGGKVRTVWVHPYAEEAVTYVLRRGASQVVESVTERAGLTEQTVFDLDGDVVDTWSWDSWASVIGQDADALWIGFYDRPTRRWVPGERPVKAGPAAFVADPDHDLLFVRAGEDEDGDELFGPTSLATPGAPAWSARFDAATVSPDGVWVAGSSYDGRYRLEVRRVSDGSVLPLPRLRPAWQSEEWVAWEPDGDLLAVVGKRRKHWIVRCTVAGPVMGECVQVAVPTSGPLGILPR